MGSVSRAQESETLQQKLRDDQGEDNSIVASISQTGSSSSCREEQINHGNTADNYDNDNDNENTTNKNGEAMMLIILAPMVRGSELAFRMMVRRRSGISLCYSPMLRAKEVVKAYKFWKEKEEQNDRITKDEPNENDDTNHTLYYGDDDNKNGSTFAMGHSQASSLSRSPSSLLSTILPLIHEDGVLFLTDTCPEDRPLVVQLCGCCPMTLYQATQAVVERYFKDCTTTRLEKKSTSVAVEDEEEEEEDEWNGIDLNLGCPQSCARDDKFGAFLVDSDPDLAIQCVAAMRRAIDDYYKDPPEVLFLESNPLLGLSTTTTTTATTTTSRAEWMSLSGIDSSIATSSTRSQQRVNRRRRRRRRRIPQLSCKMRLLDTVEETIAFAKRLEGAGCDLLTIHCRHRVVKHDGIPDQAAGQALVQTLSIPVVLNGTIQTAADISKTILGTRGVAGVMIGRALLQNPYLYQEESNNTTSINITCPALLAADYLDFAERYPPPSVLYVQKHLRWIFRATLQPPPNSAAVAAAELLLQSPSALPRRERKDKENVILKECYSNWRHRIWTFLVQPYLETMDQFRRVVVLYLVLLHGDGDAHLGQTKLLALSSSSPSTNVTVPPSLMKFLQFSSHPPSFHSIRHNLCRPSNI
jgi:tRNA-dihydrouridine synthase